MDVKNCGGLFLSSTDVFHNATEKVFRNAISGINTTKPKISSKGTIKYILVNTINQNLVHKHLFHLPHDHALEHEILTEDFHSSQLTKQIIEKYINIRLFTFGKHYTKGCAS